MKHTLEKQHCEAHLKVPRVNLNPKRVKCMTVKMTIYWYPGTDIFLEVKFQKFQFEYSIKKFII